MMSLTAFVPVIATVVLFVSVFGAQDMKKESIQLNPDDRCPRGNIQKLLPHETECSYFYICLHGRTVLQKCPHNLHFNALKSVCDFPQNAQCEKVNVIPPKGRIGDGIFSIVCPSVSNSRDNLLMSHPTDCDKYYICDNGVPQLRTCQQGLHFNPSSKACDYPEAAGCDDTSVTKSPRDHVGDGDSLCPAKNGVLPVLMKHSTDCSKFYICDNGKPHLKECQFGLQFNPKVGACDYPANVKCMNENDNSREGRRGKLPEELNNGCPRVDSDETILVSDPSDCSKYFMCHRGQSHTRTCPSGLHFNRFSQACDYPDKAQCYAMGPMLSVGVPSPFCPAVSGKIPIFYRHPNNCSIYYLCSNGLAYEFVCPARLHFNIRQKVCDYESNAKCPAGGLNL